MKKGLTFFVLLFSFVTGFSQITCIDHVKLGKPARKLLLTHDSDMAQAACDKFAEMGKLVLILDGKSWNYLYQSCDAASKTVLYLPASADDTPPVASYKMLELVFPDGVFASYPLEEDDSYYRGDILDCVAEIDHNIPTLSTWGMIVLTLVTIIFGTLIIGFTTRSKLKKSL